MLFLFCDSKERLNLVLSLAGPLTFTVKSVCVCVGLRVCVCTFIHVVNRFFLQISNISVQLYHWKMFLFFDYDTLVFLVI